MTTATLGKIAATPIVDLDVSTPADDEHDARRRAFERYVVPELGLLYAMAMRFTRDPHLAEDLVQDTIVRAYHAILRFDGRYPRAWLLTILRNTNINRARKRSPTLLHDPDLTFSKLAGRGADARDGAAEVAFHGELHPALEQALLGLSEDHQAVVALVDVDGLSYREAAQMLDVPEGTVMSRLHRARRRLRDALAGTELGREVAS